MSAFKSSVARSIAPALRSTASPSAAARKVLTPATSQILSPRNATTLAHYGPKVPGRVSPTAKSVQEPRIYALDPVCDEPILTFDIHRMSAHVPSLLDTDQVRRCLHCHPDPRRWSECKIWQQA